jgi:mono/diheme cytochrome c family protein
MNPPLVKTTYVLGDKSKLIKIVLNGFDEDVEINGETYSNTMAAHDFMKDQEIADVLTYVRNSFGNKASAVTAAQVKVTRATNNK